MPIDIAPREFHVSREARDRYQFDQKLFSISGNVIFANFHAARLFAQKMNDKRDLLNFPERAVRAGQLNALGLIDEILHYVIGRYREQKNPDILKAAIAHLEQALGKQVVDEALSKFAAEFPPVAVYQQKITLQAYLAGETAGTPNRQIVLEEMVLLWLANLNPAFSNFLELFDDSALEKDTAYSEMLTEIREYFDTQPVFGPDNQNLIDMLRTPAIKHPYDLEAQLEFIRTHWIDILGDYLYRLLSSLDFLAEEDKLFFGFGPGPAQAYEFAGQEIEAENFSPDSAWMPRVVLIAKNAYVWLDQLSKRYERAITRLDQIPDKELDDLANYGFTGLWLIGLWQRSKASQRIKQIMGNPEAVASAYSLEDYRIADDLGGKEAYNHLKARAWQRGIRLASDMVPNHMGIDSQWVIEHPDWFIGLDYSPFPSYSFNGTDLCEDARVGIYIEDHYYDRSDAAVVFKRVDHWTGDAKYIYHGNDGTSMPWNDTAQLNYLKPEVREAVIQMILEVARHSPIIRFDAAMTLTKKHYQRLWFPEPGTGGDIPSRADFGLTRDQLDAAMPEEFWREVVDRVAAEVPDTLLLAEAFWLMEGYFVRSLGMHRVYNSAFMNMMRDEKNAEYRQLIKNTLEFDPQVLKRYVNFMNNPDERTAVDQFGKGDKYFGISTMMVTMPGLPMFGHGQIEGFTEKYGMEYKRAYWNEIPDQHLVERHKRQIFPLLHKRYLFAEVDDFLLYDFFTSNGQVDENVFAYSNRSGNERGLVIYHNRYAETQGSIRASVAYAVKNDAGEKVLVQKTLAEGLRLSNNPDLYLIFRDAVSGLEYIRSSKTLVEEGLYVQLRAYEVQVFTDFREVHDNEWHQYAQLNAYLNGRGVPHIDEAMKELFLAPVHAPLRMLVSAPAYRWLMDAQVTKKGQSVAPRVLTQVEDKARDLLKAVKFATQATTDETPIAKEIRDELETVLNLVVTLKQIQSEATGHPAQAADFLLARLKEDSPQVWGTLLSWLFTHSLAKLVDEQHYAEISKSWIDEWLLGKLIKNALCDFGLEEDEAWRAVAMIKLMSTYEQWLNTNETHSRKAYQILHNALRMGDVQAYLRVNRYQGILWFNQESFEALLWWTTLLYTVQTMTATHSSPAEILTSIYPLVTQLQQAEQASNYQVTKLLENVQEQETDMQL